MKRHLASLVAAAAAALFAGNASALVVLVDNFDSPDLYMFDGTLGGGAVSAGPTLPNGRTVTHELLVGPATQTGNFSNVRIGSTTFPVGILAVANEPSINSEATVTWTLPANLVPLSSVTPASLLFEIVFSDLNTTFELYAGATLVGVFNIPASTTNLPVSFGLTPAQQDLLAVGSTMSIHLNGPTGWDLQLDSIGFVLPEPTSMALAGLALLGAGLASRRRKA